MFCWPSWASSSSSNVDVWGAFSGLLPLLGFGRGWAVLDLLLLIASGRVGALLGLLLLLDFGWVVASLGLIPLLLIEFGRILAVVNIHFLHQFGRRWAPSSSLDVSAPS